MDKDVQDEGLLMKYMGGLHSYLQRSILFSKLMDIDEASAHARYLEVDSPPPSPKTIRSMAKTKGKCYKHQIIAYKSL